MKRFLLAAAVLALVTADASAFGRRGRGQTQTTTASVTTTATSSVQWKADVQAQRGRCFHPGGGFVPGASYEGVGYSSVSPQDALAHCCNNGGAVLAQAVSRGPGGWYAVKQYAAPGSGPVRTLVSGTLGTVGDTLHATGAVFVGAGNTIRTAPVRPSCVNGVCK